jgi:hypothetical protein
VVCGRASCSRLHAESSCQTRDHMVQVLNTVDHVQLVHGSAHQRSSIICRHVCEAFLASVVSSQIDLSSHHRKDTLQPVVRADAAGLCDLSTLGSGALLCAVDFFFAWNRALNVRTSACTFQISPQALQSRTHLVDVVLCNSMEVGRICGPQHEPPSNRTFMVLGCLRVVHHRGRSRSFYCWRFAILSLALPHL